MDSGVKHRFVFPVLGLIIATTLALSVAEVSLRVLKIGYGNAPLESDSVLHHVHPADYRFLSHSASGEFGGHEVYYDEKRLRADPAGTTVTDENGMPACSVAFLGDSFTEAGTVGYEISFVGLLRRHTDCRLDNYGVTSYSPIFYLLQWTRLVKKSSPSLVVVQLYSNDISADESYFRMAKTDGSGVVTAIPGPGGGVLTKVLRKSYLVRLVRKFQLQLFWMIENGWQNHNVVSGLVEENPDVSDLSGDLIVRLAEKVRESGAELVLTVVPSKFRTVQGVEDGPSPEYSDKWRQFAKVKHIPFLDLTGPFRDAVDDGATPFYDTDIHFNELGHTLVARELSRAYPEFFDHSTATPPPTTNPPSFPY